MTFLITFFITKKKSVTLQIMHLKYAKCIGKYLMAVVRMGYKKVPLNFIHISRHSRYFFKDVFQLPSFTLCYQKKKENLFGLPNAKYIDISGKLCSFQVPVKINMLVKWCNTSWMSGALKAVGFLGLNSSGLHFVTQFWGCNFLAVPSLRQLVSVVVEEESHHIQWAYQSQTLVTWRGEHRCFWPNI